MQNNLRLIKVQTHIHGSGGHGLGSHLGYDYMASREGILDVVWWMEHEFRVANFGAVKKFAFDEFEEYLRTPNRQPDSKELFSEIAMGWEKVAGDNQFEAAISRDNIFQGIGQLHLRH